MTRMMDLIKRAYYASLPKARFDTRATEEFLNNSVVIDMGNVYNYLIETNQWRWDTLDKLPNVAPAFPLMFFEHKMDAETFQGWSVKAWDYEKDDDIPGHDAVAGAKWYLRFLMWAFNEKSPDMTPHIYGEAFVSPEGKLLPCDTYKDGAAAYFRLDVVQDSPLVQFAPDMLREQIKNASENGVINIDNRESLSPELQVMSDIAYMGSLGCTAVLWSMCFLQVRNLEKIETVPPEKLSKKHQKRYGVPLTKYYTMKILPMKKGKKFGSDSEPNGGSHNNPALHIRAGHFKEFTDAAPLFGKWTGVYWWNTTAVGKAEKGQVNKDYAIELDDEENKS